MRSEQMYEVFPARPEWLTVSKEKGKLSRFHLHNAAGDLVARLDWPSVFRMGTANGSWSGGRINFKHRRWWSADFIYQLEGKSEVGELPFVWKRLTNAILWDNEQFHLKTKGWFLRHFQLFDAQDELLAEFRIREKFISFKIEISLESRLFRYKNPEALVLTGLFLLFIRLRRAKSAG